VIIVGRVLRKLLAIAGVVIPASVGVVASSASASPLTGCLHQYLCVYTQYSGAGTRVQFFYSNTSWAGDSVDNNDYSSGNNGTQYVAVYNYFAGTWGSSPKNLCLPVNTYFNSEPSAGTGSANLWTTSSC
jgi:hypothetical protein